MSEDGKYDYPKLMEKFETLVELVTDESSRCKLCPDGDLARRHYGRITKQGTGLNSIIAWQEHFSAVHPNALTANHNEMSEMFLQLIEVLRYMARSKSRAKESQESQSKTLTW